MPDKPLVTRPAFDIARKVKAIVALAGGIVLLIVVLIVVQAAFLADATRLDELIGTLSTALVGLLGALVAAYATRERAS